VRILAGLVKVSGVNPGRRSTADFRNRALYDLNELLRSKLGETRVGLGHPRRIRKEAFPPGIHSPIEEAFSVLGPHALCLQTPETELRLELLHWDAVFVAIRRQKIVLPGHL
jgi:hypothetical protein